MDDRYIKSVYDIRSYSARLLKLPFSSATFLAYFRNWQWMDAYCFLEEGKTNTLAVKDLLRLSEFCLASSKLKLAKFIFLLHCFKLLVITLQDKVEFLCLGPSETTYCLL